MSVNLENIYCERTNGEGKVQNLIEMNWNDIKF